MDYSFFVFFLQRNAYVAITHACTGTRMQAPRHVTWSVVAVVPVTWPSLGRHCRGCRHCRGSSVPVSVIICDWSSKGVLVHTSRSKGDMDMHVDVDFDLDKDMDMDVVIDVDVDVDMDIKKDCRRKVSIKKASDAVVREPRPPRKRAKVRPRNLLTKPHSELFNQSAPELKATPESKRPGEPKPSVLKPKGAPKASAPKASVVKASLLKPSVLPQVGVPTLGADGQQYGVYVLANTVDLRTYVGCTNDFARRRRQHCGFLVGGAKATRGCTTWYFHACVTGFASRHMALSFEWYVKRYRKYTPADLQTAAQTLALTPALNPSLALHASAERSKPAHKRTLQLGRLLAKFGGEGGRFPNLTVHYLALPDTS